MELTVLPQEGGLGSTLGAGLGQGLAQGLGHQLSQMFENRSNMKASNGLADQLGLKGEQRNTFVNAFGKLPADKQIPAYRNLLEIQQTLGSRNAYENPLNQQDNFQNAQNDLEPQQNAEKESNNKLTLPGVEGIEFDRSELTPILSKPQKMLNTEERRYQEERLKENRAELKKEAESYDSAEVYEQRLRDIDKLENLFSNYDPNLLQQALLAGIESLNFGPLKALLSTDDQQLIDSLIIPLVKTKEFGGSNPSTKEVILKMQQYPGIYKSKAVNRLLTEALRSDLMVSMKKAQIIREVRRLNPEASLAELTPIVDKAISKFRKETVDNPNRVFTVKVYDPESQKMVTGTVTGWDQLDEVIGKNKGELIK